MDIVKISFTKKIEEKMEANQSDCVAVNPKIIEKISSQMPDEILLSDLSDFFKVMGDTTRINILWALEKESVCVNDLAVLLNMTKSAVSHQLKILRIAKLVRADKKGKNVYYALNDDHVKTIWAKAIEHLTEK